MPEFDDFSCSAHAHIVRVNNARLFRTEIPIEKTGAWEAFLGEPLNWHSTPEFLSSVKWNAHAAETTLCDFKELPSRIELLFFEKTSHIYTGKVCSSRFFHFIIHANISQKHFEVASQKHFNSKYESVAALTLSCRNNVAGASFSSSVMNNTPKGSPPVTLFVNI